MNNLTTRKIVLGMLMALVLAFSVQGIADAALLGAVKESRPAIFRRNQREITFEITFELLMENWSITATRIQNTSRRLTTSNTLLVLILKMARGALGQAQVYWS